jgi:hypothetical protein
MNPFRIRGDSIRNIYNDIRSVIESISTNIETLEFTESCKKLEWLNSIADKFVQLVESLVEWNRQQRCQYGQINLSINNGNRMKSSSIGWFYYLLVAIVALLVLLLRLMRKVPEKPKLN